MEAPHRTIAWLRRHPLAADALVAGLLGTLVLITFVSTPAQGSEREADAIGIAMVVAVHGALVFRRRRPVETLGVITALSMVLLVRDYSAPHMLASVVALYSVGAHVDRPRSLRAFAAAIAVFTVIALIGWSIAEEDVSLPEITWSVAILSTAFVIGDNLRGRRAHLATLEARAADLEREQEQLAQRAVIDERQRIARELHDIVAHTMSVMVVQAGAARRLLDHQPDRARTALESVEETGRAGLDEMRRIVGVLRTDDTADGTAADFAPQPGLARLPELIANCGEAGLSVELDVEGEPLDIPAGVDLSAYRVVQEALTNTMKHAGPARASVTVRWSDRTLDIQVTDDGRGAASNGHGTGHGLMGMRERVDLYGGRLRAGPRAGGGYEVSASLPLSEAGAR